MSPSRRTKPEDVLHCDEQGRYESLAVWRPGRPRSATAAAAAASKQFARIDTSCFRIMAAH